MRKKHLASNKIRVHVYGSRYLADKKAANTAYHNLGTGKQIQFPREGNHAHSFGIPATGNIAEIEHYVWQFICIAEILGMHNTPAYQFEVQHFDGFTVEEIAPLFYGAFKIPNITLPQEYHAYIRRISTEQGLPTLTDINIDDSLDERAAVRNFLGKTAEDVYHLLKENIPCDCSFMESFYYLGPDAFAYYVPAWERVYHEYRGHRFSEDDDDDLYEELVAEAALFFISQRTLLYAEQETAQGRATLLRLLDLIEHHYSTEPLYDAKEREKALQQCKQLRKEQLKNA